MANGKLATTVTSVISASASVSPSANDMNLYKSFSSNTNISCKIPPIKAPVIQAPKPAVGMFSLFAPEIALVRLPAQIRHPMNCITTIVLPKPSLASLMASSAAKTAKIATGSMARLAPMAAPLRLPLILGDCCSILVMINWLISVGVYKTFKSSVLARGAGAASG